jgi:cobalt-zinc-cadmium efflux system protein
MLSDVAALGLSLGALWLAERPAPRSRTFGWRRIEILAALANGVALVVIAVFVAIEAVERLGRPREVLGLPMLLVAVGGLAVNLAGLAILEKGRHGSLNLRGAWLHVLSDALGSVGVIAAALAIWVFGWTWADPAASLAIAVLVLHASYRLLRETVDVLLEAAPSHLDVEEIASALAAVPGAVQVHDLHVWTITSGLVSLSCHVRRAADCEEPVLLAALHGVLRERFAIHHATIQIEGEAFEDSAAHVC